MFINLIFSSIIYIILFSLIFSYQLKDIKKGILKAIFWELGIFGISLLFLIPFVITVKLKLLKKLN